MNRIAVLMAVHNGETYLAETLDTILNQTLTDFHLYVVDDGSTDGTPQVLARYAQRANVTHLRQRNRGQAAALNTALALGREPFVTPCDADDLWHPTKLQRVLAVAERHPETGLIVHDFARGRDPSQPWHSAWASGGYTPVSGSAFATLLRQNFVMRPATLIPRRCLEVVGGFNETIGGRCGSDDRHLWLELSRRWPITCEPEVLAFIRVHAGQSSGSIGSAESKVRLWRYWLQQLRDDPSLARQAQHNLGETLFDLAYLRRQRHGQTWTAWREFLTAAWHGYRPLTSLRLAAMTLLRMSNQRPLLTLP